MGVDTILESLADNESLQPHQYLIAARKIAAEYGDDTINTIALLGSGSLAAMEPYLLVESAKRGIYLKPWAGPYGQLEQQILDHSSELWKHNVSVFVILMAVEEIAPEFVLRANKIARQALQTVYDGISDRIANAVAAIRAKCDAPILVANHAIPNICGSDQVFDASALDGLSAMSARANLALLERFSDQGGVTIWDYAGLIRRCGASDWTDRRLWFTARQQIGSNNLGVAAAHLSRSIGGNIRPPAKCVVFDLDNTIWGGVIGDDGIEGIQLGDDYPGSIFKEIQRAILALKDRGVLLAVSSKNDKATARAVFDSHPDMVIKWEDLAAHRISWEQKSVSIEEIATELNIGLDSLVFLDDNPVERESVRQQVPNVHVVELAADPATFAKSLFDSELFDFVSTSDEDGKRTKYYRQETQRRSLEAKSHSLGEFLSSLEMKMEIGAVETVTLDRAVQILAKTNQFNLTTRRHSHATIKRYMQSPDWDVRWMRLSDRYGDAGIIGITIVHYKDDTALIDSLAMSCRVMNRFAENAMVSDIASRAAARECQYIEGQYCPTAKNEIVANLYATLGFSTVGTATDCQRYQYEIDGESVSDHFWPDSIARQST